MELVKLGEIVNVRGLKGEVKIYSCSSFSTQRYQKDSKIILKKDNITKELTVLKHSFVNPFDYVIFNEISNVDEANLLRGYEVLMSVNDLPKLSDGSYYYYELKDIDVYDSNNNYIGKVINVENNNASDLLRIKTNNNEVLVPFVKAFINKVDLDDKKIIINIIEGLI